MTDLADRTISALRSQHDQLSALAAGLSDDQLAAGSGASEWPVAQVLSHLGSGSEIGLATLLGTPVVNEEVWDRWNAMASREQADGFVEHSRRIVEALEGLGPEGRTTRTVDLGFLPEPVPLTTYLGMRINEVAHHGWDVRVALDPDAALDEDVARLLAEHYAGGLAFLLGFAAKPERLGEPATVVLGDSGYAIEIAEEGVRLSTSAAAPTATFLGPLESAQRLLAGRLTPEHTPDGVGVAGNVTLDELRDVFPGY